MRPGKLVRIGRVAQGFNFAQFLPALLKLVERFKFQQVNFLSAACTRTWRGTCEEPSGSIAVGFRERQETPCCLEPVV